MVQTVYMRILTTDTAPETEARVRDSIRELLAGEEIAFAEFTPYWKIEGWGELNGTMRTARNLKDIQTRFADNWECDTATKGIRLPGVGFLWISE